VFKRIDHIEIVTDQPKETERFYTELLGFRVKARDHIARPGAAQKLRLTYLDLGGTTVELISYEGRDVEPAPQGEHLGYRMMALEVDDIDQAAEQLKSKGVPIVWGPVVRDSYARAEICDPNGFRIELRQWF
jgi:catechol 2,3-dioxygenase-like lactoylglutathione lyase family enzyme